VAEEQNCLFHERTLDHANSHLYQHKSRYGMLFRMTLRAEATLLTRWDDVRFFLAVLRHGSFTGAAEALKTEQSTVSRRIAALEEALDLQLFERGSRAPVPTSIALSLRSAAESLEVEVGRFSDLALGASEQKVRGRVRLALTEEMAITFVIPHVLPRVRRELPELEIDLVTSYRAADLMGHEADIALRFFQSKRGDIVGKKIGSLESTILCSKKQSRIWEKLSIDELDWVVVELEGMTTPESSWFHKFVRQRPVLTCTSYQAQLAAIRAGLGVGVGPTILPGLDCEYVELCRPQLELPRLDLFLYTRRSIRTLPRIASLFQLLDDELTRALQGSRRHSIS
jgi:DNA-binding transcriptional LysR family regulator